MARIVLAFLFVLGVVFCSACGPTQEPARISTELGPDGYALFKARHEGGSRLAFLVELRDVPAGTYVLLHTRKAPASEGWFDLDVRDYAPCKRYGVDATDETQLGCVLPDGHGDLVDLVEVTTSPAAASSPSSPSSAHDLLRHEIAVRPSTCSDGTSSCSSSATVEGYYAVMRVEHDGRAVPIAVEVRAIDDEAWQRPSVERLE